MTCLWALPVQEYYPAGHRLGRIVAMSYIWAARIAPAFTCNPSLIL